MLSFTSIYERKAGSCVRVIGSGHTYYETFLREFAKVFGVVNLGQYSTRSASQELKVLHRFYDRLRRTGGNGINTVLDSPAQQDGVHHVCA